MNIGSTINNYRIEAILGSGGFGVTYAATDIDLDKAVAIKEYFPSAFATRSSTNFIAPTSDANKKDYDWGLSSFLEEGRTLARFDHPHINRVLTFFKANGTAYLVLERIFGRTLSDVLTEEKRLNDTRTRRVLNEIGNGLHTMHTAGFLHRDVKPANIMFREDNGAAVLLDFGSARQQLSERTNLVTTLLTPGYAPAEQYLQNLDHAGAWTDIYALGMVGYRCISGVTDSQLIHAPDREKRALGRKGGIDMPSAQNLANESSYDIKLLRSIDWAIRPLEEDRPQSVSQWFEQWGNTNNFDDKKPDQFVNHTTPPPIKKKRNKTNHTDQYAAAKGNNNADIKGPIPPPISTKHRANLKISGKSVEPAPIIPKPIPYEPASPTTDESSTGGKILLLFSVVIVVAVARGIFTYISEPEITSDIVNKPATETVETTEHVSEWRAWVRPDTNVEWQPTTTDYVADSKQSLSTFGLDNYKLVDVQYSRAEAYEPFGSGVWLIEYVLEPNEQTESPEPYHYQYLLQNAENNNRYHITGNGATFQKINEEVGFTVQNPAHAASYLKLFISTLVLDEANADTALLTPNEEVELETGESITGKHLRFSDTFHDGWAAAHEQLLVSGDVVYLVSFLLTANGKLSITETIPRGRITNSLKVNSVNGVKSSQ